MFERLQLTVLLFVGVALTVAAQTPQFKLRCPGANHLGRSVAISGETLIVGAPWSSSQVGSAYVYQSDGQGGWGWGRELTTWDSGREGDQFGYAVSISGSTAVVGAYCRDRAGLRDDHAGVVYVFIRSSSGAWTQQKKLRAARPAAGDRFGNSVSVSGNTIVAGAYRDDDGGSDAGAARVFTRSDGVWKERTKLIADDAAAGDAFGCSVSVSGDTIVVGAYGDDDGGHESGSAYIFIRSGVVWHQQRKLVATNPERYDYFGSSVSISGDTVVVGAHGDDTDGGDNAGSAYAFIRSGDIWTQQQKLIASDAWWHDDFGRSVSILGDTVVVGVPYDDDGGDDAGATYVFTRSAGVWTERLKLIADDAAAKDLFGYSVAVDGERVLVGAPYDDNPETASGAAYVFDIISLTGSRPNGPFLISPAHGARELGLAPILLRASSFSEPDPGATHAATQWLVDDDPEFRTPEWIGEDTDADKESETVPLGTLAKGTTYYWCCRYINNHGTVGYFSAVRYFVTVEEICQASPSWFAYQ